MKRQEAARGANGRQRNKGPRPPLRPGARIPVAPLLLVAVCWLHGCDGILEVENASEPVLLAGMGPQECPWDWDEDELPGALHGDLDDALTQVFTDVRHQIDSEARLRSIGDTKSIRFDYLVLHTSSATSILTSQDTLGFLQEIRVFFEPVRSPSRLDRVLVARHDFITETATAIILDTSEVNVKPYFSEGFRVTTDVVPRTCLAEDLTLRLSFRAKVRYKDD